MKKAADIFLRAAFVLLLFPAIPAASAADKSKSQPLPFPNIRVDVLMVAMPEEKFITLLPDLLDRDKIEKAIPGLLEAVKRKEIILEGYPFVVTKSGERAVIETVKEVHDPDHPLPWMGSMPGDIFTRNIGVTLEVEASPSDIPGIIEINLSPQHVEWLKPQSPVQTGSGAGEPSKSDEPKPDGHLLYFTMKTTTSVALQNGRHLLIGTHKMVKPQGYIEVMILHAEILPVDK
jgi:hypothetical protein